MVNLEKLMICDQDIMSLILARRYYDAPSKTSMMLQVILQV
jgi:hypothetical protein